MAEKWMINPGLSSKSWLESVTFFSDSHDYFQAQAMAKITKVEN
jgi:hypothetical protein